MNNKFDANIEYFFASNGIGFIGKVDIQIVLCKLCDSKEEFKATNFYLFNSIFHVRESERKRKKMPNTINAIIKNKSLKIILSIYITVLKWFVKIHKMLSFINKSVLSAFSAKILRFFNHSPIFFILFSFSQAENNTWAKNWQRISWKIAWNTSYPIRYVSFFSLLNSYVSFSEN